MDIDRGNYFLFSHTYQLSGEIQHQINNLSAFHKLPFRNFPFLSSSALPRHGRHIRSAPAPGLDGDHRRPHHRKGPRVVRPPVRDVTAK